MQVTLKDDNCIKQHPANPWCIVCSSSGQSTAEGSCPSFWRHTVHMYSNKQRNSRLAYLWTLSGITPHNNRNKKRRCRTALLCARPGLSHPPSWHGLLGRFASTVQSVVPVHRLERPAKVHQHCSCPQRRRQQPKVIRQPATSDGLRLRPQHESRRAASLAQLQFSLRDEDGSTCRRWFWWQQPAQ
jgi:hypothetical protein